MASLNTPSYHIKTENTYHPIDTISATSEAGLGSFIAGSLFSALKNSMNHKVVGPWGILGANSKAILLFTVGGSSYVFAHGVANNLREKNDAVNDFYGGLVAGTLMGTATRAVFKTVGLGLLVGVGSGLLSWGGYSLTGLGKDSSYNSIDKTDPFNKETKHTQGFWEMAYRRPLSQTVNDLGENNVVFRP